MKPAMQAALHKLDYKCYHMATSFQPVGLLPVAHRYWIEALRAKNFGEGEPYGPAEFDKLLGNYSVILSSPLFSVSNKVSIILTTSTLQALTDMPCVNFTDELLAAYPNAKVILTLRDPDKWIDSMKRTLLSIASWPSLKFITPFDPVCFLDHMHYSFEEPS
jgi:hypothetical protein